MRTNRKNSFCRMVRNASQSLCLSLIDPIVRLIDRRFTEYAVREYHKEQWRNFRLRQVNEKDPEIASWFGRQAEQHRRFCA